MENKEEKLSKSKAWSMKYRVQILGVSGKKKKKKASNPRWMHTDEGGVYKSPQMMKCHIAQTPPPKCPRHMIPKPRDTGNRERSGRIDQESDGQTSIVLLSYQVYK